MIEQQYFIHDRTRGFVGNSMMWWRVNHCGYTCDITDAHRFSEEEARRRVSQADDLVAYTVESVEQWIEHHVTNRMALTSLATDEDRRETK